MHGDKAMNEKCKHGIRDGSATACQYKGCRTPAVVEISGFTLSKPGWWRMCAAHSRVFAAQRPLAPNVRMSEGGPVT